MRLFFQYMCASARNIRLFYRTSSTEEKIDCAGFVFSAMSVGIFPGMPLVCEAWDAMARQLNDGTMTSVSSVAQFEESQVVVSGG